MSSVLLLVALIWVCPAFMILCIAFAATIEKDSSITALVACGTLAFACAFGAGWIAGGLV